MNDKNSDFLADLNEQQRCAVTHPARRLRIIAGAGSGKTRVLVRRIQWLMTQQNCAPSSILALAFTNKAAQEMRTRLKQFASSPLWVGTFHSICNRMLRHFGDRVGWQRDFIIMDAQDQLAAIKKILKIKNLDKNSYQAKNVAWKINSFKQQALRAGDLRVANNFYEMMILREVYLDYEQWCRDNNCMDFAELLLQTLELLQINQEVREYYQRQFAAVLVDEFQDSNSLQFQIVELLCRAGAQLFVVGDDDQSIYGWGGANIENILSLERYFPDLQSVSLEQNYRSTRCILDAANALITKNNNRLRKKLWTSGQQGDKPCVFAARNEYAEANYVVGEIVKLTANSNKLADCAILYRAHAQSRIFEEELRRNGINFHVYGGLPFFSRAEIKDSIAYLRLVIARDNDAALLRIINTPKRNLGSTSIARLETLAQQKGVSLWDCMQDTEIMKQFFSQRTRNSFINFVKCIENMHNLASAQRSLSTASLQELLSIIIHNSGLYDYYQQQSQKNAVAADKLDNLNELIAAAAQRDAQYGGDLEMALQDLLTTMALSEEQQHENKNIDVVNLMTLHAAKGLEFQNVFMVGVEEDLLPSIYSVGDKDKIEEERRLAYVGMTRAKHYLSLSYAEKRWHSQHDESSEKLKLSRFITEIPRELLFFKNV